MSSSSRDRSVGRRISSFFGAGQQNPTSPSKPPAPSSPLGPRPASRGRPLMQDTQNATQLPAPTGTSTGQPRDARPLPVRMISSDGLVPPPHVPYATDAQGSRSASPATSRPTSRQDSRVNSRAASPIAHAHSVQAHPDGFHNPMHSGTAPEPAEPAPPALLGPPRAKTYSLEAEKKLKRRSWMPGSKDKSVPKATTTSAVKAPKAWITGHPDKIAYDTTPLIQGQPLAELWDESGDTLIHLFPQSAQKGPSLRIHSSVFSSSPMLTQLAYGDVYSHRQRTSGDRTPSSASKPPVLPSIAGLGESDNSSSSSSRGTRTSVTDFDDDPRQISLHVPILSGGGALSAANKSDTDVTTEDMDALLAVRNMFSFLLGQSLVATERRPTLFGTFLRIADSLTAYGFTNIDGSTYGEIAATSFDQYVDEIGLADVRSSREKTIESIVLGERMRSVLLYNDAFTHAVGKYSDIQEVCQLPGPAQKLQLISQTTRNRMERASIDLYHREKSMNLRLSHFDFPSVFAGILDSKGASEQKQFRLTAWRDAFGATRRHVLSYYKHKFGSWPPKASSKKNNLETGGLNRLVLQELYRDFADIYDLYVDRTSLTVRVNNDLLIEHLEDDDNEPVTRIIRRVFDEYDRANVPVQPPIPFDVPLLPSFSTVSGKLSVHLTGDPKADARVKQKKFNQEEASRTLDSAYNPDTLARCKQSPFLVQFRAFEHKQGKGSTIAQMADFRLGVWIFLYAVMQALPLLAVDAPNVRFAHGVEYFLCEPPRAGVPWANPEAARAHGRVSRTWFGVAGGGVVSLPSDLIEHGVEGVYRRSHCWLRAKEWSAHLGIQASEVINGQMTDEPQAVGGSESEASTLRAPSGPPLSRASAEHTRSISQPFALPSLPYGNMVASRSAHNLGVPNAPSVMAPPGGLAPPGSRPTTPGAPRSASTDRRKSVLQLGLEALPLPQGVAPQGAGTFSSQPGSAMHSTQNSISSAAPRSRPVTKDGPPGGMTFDDIIKGMEADKPKKGKKGR